MMPHISLIAAISENRVIGDNNDLIWKIPNDLARFKRITMGHPIIMGRKTFSSIGKALPGRKNIIITRSSDFSAPGCVIAHSLDEALISAKAEEHEEIFIIGGGEIFNQAMSTADRIYLTLVHQTVTGDVYFPEYSAFKKVVSRENGNFDGMEYEYLVLERENSAK